MLWVFAGMVFMMVFVCTKLGHMLLVVAGWGVAAITHSLTFVKFFQVWFDLSQVCCFLVEGHYGGGVGLCIAS